MLEQQSLFESDPMKTTSDLVVETNIRSERLQQLAFEASSLLSPKSDERFFIVSMEYYSRSFYGQNLLERELFL